MWQRLRRWLAGVPDDVSASALLTTEDYLTTLLQIVPSAVVAVFVFAAGTVFVIAQVIAAPLGSRGIEELLASSRGRRVLFFGVALLVPACRWRWWPPTSMTDCPSGPRRQPLFSPRRRWGTRSRPSS